ncbi:E3 ubiquitin-protein ligase UHRF1 [Apiospora kogelbergensis]|uniref:E3 ubiquitin-protein ligase UHRF1 n=1 Tax=Apiospora kogelbergensis TaxID=1337665 RepID=UPI0031304AB0
MANQLKRKRSGSPVAIIRGLVVGDGREQIGQEKHVRADIRAKSTKKASMVDEAPGTASPADPEEDTAVAGQDAEDVVDILDIPTARQDCITSMQKEHLAIKNFAVKSKKKKQVPTSEPEDIRRLARFIPYLNFLEFKLEMNHRIFKESKVADTLALMNKPGFYFPADVAECAARLVAGWEDGDWNEDPPEVQEEIPAPFTRNTAPNNAGEEAPAVQIKVPSARDPIFGTDGIMNGVISTRNSAGRKVHMLNPLLTHKPSKEFGHNGLQVGQWFPLRLVALHHGAHGASQAGIYASITAGAYSIVAGNSAYHHLDQDEGNTLYYSTPRSHENTDPNNVAAPSSGTLALRASASSGRPVRVLRAAGGGTNSWLPGCGIRYDGLYQVVAVRETKNVTGELYEQFKLVRLLESVNGKGGPEGNC